METRDYLELTKEGNWYTLEFEYDHQLDVFKAHGKQQLNELIDDLIHDVKLDERFDLIEPLQALRIV